MGGRVSESRYWLGCDLGQANDPTALVVVEKLQVPSGELGPAHIPKLVNVYHARHVERVPLGTSYPSIVQRVKTLLEMPPLWGATELVADATGCGRPVMDMLRAARLRPVCVVITAGYEVTSEGFYLHVPKTDLIAAVQVLLQSQRLKIAPSLPEAATLIHELEGYQQRITAAAHVQYGQWREGEHDDVLLALALACWRGEASRSRTPVGLS